MSLLWVAVIGGVTFLVGLLLGKRRRSRSPVEGWEREQRAATRSEDLFAQAGAIDEVRDLILRGNKRLRLKEAKEAVEAIEREMRGARD